MSKAMYSEHDEHDEPGTHARLLDISPLLRADVDLLTKQIRDRRQHLEVHSLLYRQAAASGSLDKDQQERVELDLIKQAAEINRLIDAVTSLVTLLANPALAGPILQRLH